MKKKTNSILVTYPWVKILIPFVLGILASAQLRMEYGLIIAIVSVLCLILIYFYEQTHLKNILAFFLLFGLGFTWSTIQDQFLLKEDQLIEELLETEIDFDLYGTIRNIKENSKLQYTVDIDSICIDDYKLDNCTSSLIVRADNDRDHFIGLDDKVHFKVQSLPLKKKRNPSQFDYKSYLLSKDIAGITQLKEIVSVEKINSLQFIKDAYHKKIENIIDVKYIGLVKALVLGDKSMIDPDTRVSFNRSGLAHIMAVSGLHVGFIIAPIWLIIPWMWTFRTGRIFGIILLALILFSYSWLTGFSASVIRASMMAFLFTYAKLFEKVRYPMNILAGVAFILLVIRPNYIFDIGFQLSFSAVAIIISILPRIQFLTETDSFIKKNILGSLIVGLVVQIGLAPILIYYFGELSVVSPISNIIALLPASILVVVGLFGTSLTLIIPFIDGIVGAILNVFSFLLLEISTGIGSQNWSFIEFSKPSSHFFLFWGILLIVLSVIHLKEIRWKWIIILLLSIIGIQGKSIVSDFKKTLNVYFFDVGQGDASLIQTPNHKNYLIDTGLWSPNYNSGERVILPELKRLGVSKIDGLILTHAHADHIGGTESIIEHFEIETIYFDTTSTERSKLFTRIIDKARKKDIPIKSLYAGDELELDSNVFCQVIWPLKQYNTSNKNNESIVFRVDYLDNSFLFTGDAERESETYWSSYLNEAIDVDVLKVGHHGSKTSTTQEFLNDITADMAILSVGFKNKFKHPHASTMYMLNNHVNEVYSTSLEGMIHIQSDGQNIRKVEWR